MGFDKPSPVVVAAKKGANAKDAELGYQHTLVSRSFFSLKDI